MVCERIDQPSKRVGEELGVTNWHEVTQREIDGFAELTAHALYRVIEEADR